MICPACKQETEPGKFCTNCGATLPNEEVAASTDPIEAAEGTHQVTTETEQTKSTTKQNEIGEKMKEAATSFGSFFVNIIKKPSRANQVGEKQWISGIISIVLFVLLFSVSMVIALTNSYIGTSFVDGFLAPFLRLLILFAVMIGLTFGGIKIKGQSNSIMDIIAKYGAYLVPFFALAIVGGLLAIIQLPFSGILIVLSLIAPVLLIPTFILLEEKSKGFDTIYVLIGLYIIGIVIAGYIIQNMLMTFLGDFLF